MNPGAITAGRLCASCACDISGLRSDAATCARRACKVAKWRADRAQSDLAAVTDEDRAAAQRVVADGLPPVPTEHQRHLRLAAAQPRVPAFTGSPVEVDAARGPGGDPAPILRALRARRSA